LGAAIGRDLSGERPRGIAISGGTVGHDLRIDGLAGRTPSGDSFICGTNVGHDLTIKDGNASATLIDIGGPPDCLAGDSIRHDLVVQNNAGPVVVSANGSLQSPIGHDLTIIGN